jgi:hypothetical protein
MTSQNENYPTTSAMMKPNGEGGQPTAMEEVTAKIGELAEPLKEKATEVAKDKIEAGASQLKMFANAMHGAASELEGQMPKVATYVRDAGNKLEDAAASVHEKNVEELLEGFNDFAKQQPALVFGAATIAGFALARFLKISTLPQPQAYPSSTSQLPQ